MENVLTASKAFLPTKKDWLIRTKFGCALIWQRKWLLGFIPVPWALHGCTRLIRTWDMGPPVPRAKEYIREQMPNAHIKVEKYNG